jgi:hypothetical protein
LFALSLGWDTRGTFYASTQSLDQLENRFTTWPDYRFVFIDEAAASTRREADMAWSKLKVIITSNDTSIERKGKSVLSVDNMTGLAFGLNDDHMLRYGNDTRRIFHVKLDPYGEKARFDGTAQEKALLARFIKEARTKTDWFLSQVKGMREYLRQYNTIDFSTEYAPDTNIKLEVREINLPPYINAILDELRMLGNGELPKFITPYMINEAWKASQKCTSDIELARKFRSLNLTGLIRTMKSSGVLQSTPVKIPVHSSLVSFATPKEGVPLMSRSENDIEFSYKKELMNTKNKLWNASYRFYKLGDHNESSENAADLFQAWADSVDSKFVVK